MKRLIIIAPLSSLSKRTRLYKLAKFCQMRFPGISIQHVAWERASGESKEDYLSNISKKVILSGGGYGGSSVRVRYIFWMLKVFIQALFLNKDETVWALGFESAFPVMLASKLKKFKVIFDDADRFSMIFPLPNKLKKYVESLEEYTSRNVALHVVPGISRYNFKSDSLYILRNMPSKSEVDEAVEIYKSKSWPEAKVVIYVNGWLGDSRGMAQVLYLSEQLKSESFKIILAGKLDGDDAISLSRKENVLYLGEVSNSEALSAYFASDFVFTYYDPSVQINRYAESNKWGDALKTSTAVIVNSEVKTADYLRDRKVAISYDYDDRKGLLGAVRRCIQDFRYKEAYTLEQPLCENYPYFEEQLEEVLSRK